MVSIQAKQKHQIATSMFSRAGGKEPKKRSEVAEAVGEVAKEIKSAIAGVVPSAKHASTSLVASPAKSMDLMQKNDSK